MSYRSDLATEDIATRYLSGEPSYVIARDLACAVGTVFLRLKQAGVESRPMGKGFRLKGEAHPRWKGGRAQSSRVRGVRVNPYPPDWPSVRNTHRAEYPICQDCGMRRSVLVHHKDRNRYNNEHPNLLALCKGCHEREHEQDPHKPYPGPSPETRAKWKGRTPWNKGLTKSTHPNLRGGRRCQSRT